MIAHVPVWDFLSQPVVMPSCPLAREAVLLEILPSRIAPSLPNPHNLLVLLLYVDVSQSINVTS